jgi:hypothetical protein
MKNVFSSQQFVHHVIACVLTICAVGMTFLTLNDYGIVWDEPYYFSQAESYTRWILHPELKKKDSVFEVKSDFDIHPPFRKMVGGLTKYVFTDTLKKLDNTRGYRISGLLFVIPFIYVFSLTALEIGGVFAGILGTILFLFLPHMVFLAPLLTLDYAVAALWFLCLVTLRWGMKRALWLVVSAALLGLTLLTKLHGVFLFIPVFSYLFFHYKTSIDQQRQTSTRRYVFIALLFLVVPLVVYIAGWPWLWTNPAQKILEYLAVQRRYTGVPVYILGHIYTLAPWFYTLLTFLVSTPLYILVLSLYGSARIWKTASSVGRWAVGNALFGLVLFTLPLVPKYDGVRLFLFVYPFVYLTAIYGISQIIASVSNDMMQKTIRMAALGILAICTIYISVIKIHPFESSYYNELVGGLDGASNMGFETEYWGNAYFAVLPWMNAHKQHMMCVYPVTSPFYYYQAMGYIEPGVVFEAGKGACEYLVVLMRRGFFDRSPDVKKVVETQIPIYSYTVSKTALVNVYELSRGKDASVSAEHQQPMESGN